MSIGDTERATQDRVVSFFKDRDILDYEYVGNLKDAANKNIREDRLRAYLRLSGYSQKLIDGAVSELVKAADDMTHGLYDANHKVYSLLKYGAKVKETADGAPKTVYFMDVETPTNNDSILPASCGCRNSYGICISNDRKNGASACFF